MTPHEAVRGAAAAHGLDPVLLEAIMLVESGGQADAFRWEPVFYRTYIQGKTTHASQFGPLAACSFGALQILLEVAYEFGFTGDPWELFELERGLSYGALYLRALLDWAHDDVAKAVSAYNGGKGTAEHGPPYANQVYVDRVLTTMKGL